VNAFLNTLANDDPNAVSDGQMAFNFASDEPNQLMALSGDLAADDTAGHNAVAVLSQVFPTVPMAFQAIANSGGDQGVISQQVALINSVRLVIIPGSWRCQTKKANMRVIDVDVPLFCHKLGSCLMLLRETMALAHRLPHPDHWFAPTHLRLLEMGP
jgi:hypothetical protein